MSAPIALASAAAIDRVEGFENRSRLATDTSAYLFLWQ
jgi:hypothetical protein